VPPNVSIVSPRPRRGPVAPSAAPPFRRAVEAVEPRRPAALSFARRTSVSVPTGEALFQGRHRTLPFERPAVPAAVAGGVRPSGGPNASTLAALQFPVLPLGRDRLRSRTGRRAKAQRWRLRRYRLHPRSQRLNALPGRVRFPGPLLPARDTDRFLLALLSAR
jgi:hypothetical protein